ncbi:N-acetylneuraminate synthase family protein [Phaeospirillum tilakii]|uniref:N-acetylneuraminate synthase family protein n=1 Tax=Phaeospirillum tilakii TaxID=741673 RepID=A0ABW5CE63_9PROT
MAVHVVAEVGPNHNGSLETAFEMIRRLAATGVDSVKFQLGAPERVYSRDAFKADYQKRNDGERSAIEMSKAVQFPREAHLALAAACAEAGVAYACTAFDVESLRFLDEAIDLPYFKVASGELLTLDMLEFIAERRRPVQLSTGMSTFEEIDQALGVLTAKGLRDITILHCVSNYPAPYADINLRLLPELARRFGLPVGYSDHSLGVECCLAAVALGACVLEKHVTPDPTLPGPDHKASATIEEMGALVSSVRKVEQALGGAGKVFSAAEEGVRRMARKSIVTAIDLPAGHVLTSTDITFKRPGTGVSPMERDRVIGRRLARPLEADRVITPDDLA